MLLNVVDWSIIIVYFLFIFSIGFYFLKRQTDTGQFFLAGRRSRWYTLGPTIFAANISSEHFIGLAGSGAAMGLAVGAYEWMAVFCLFVLGWLFIPYYFSSRVFTMPEFLERRYNAGTRWYLSIVSIVAYIFTKISVALFAGSILIKVVFGWDPMLSAIVLVIAAGIYTAMGGLAAVIWADMVQTTIIILGAAALTLLGLHQVGGFAGLRAALPPSFFDMTWPASHPIYPWTGTMIGIFILGIWYWATDQFIVQKSLSARNVSEARGGINFTALLKILPVFILVLPGLIARALWPVEIAADPDHAFPHMLTRLLPHGLIGLVVAALLAALVSSLAATFNSSSTLITMDIYRKIRPQASEKRLVATGRWATVAIVLLGIAWIPIIRLMSNQLYQYLQAVQSYISPPITAVFLAGVLWKRTTAPAAMTTLIAGGVLGAVRFAMDIIDKTGTVNWGPLGWFVHLAFLNYAILAFVICVGILVVVSLLGKPPAAEKQQVLFIDKKAIQSGSPVWTWVNVIASVLIGLTVVSLWAWFS